MSFFVNYSRWVSMVAALLMIAACFMPWAYYPDLDKSFTGFFSHNNVYGKPGKLLITLSVFSVIAQFTSSIFLKRTNLLLMALNLAYAIKSFIVYASCYKGFCPQKQAGLYLVILSALVLMITAALPSGKLTPGEAPKEEKA